MNRTIKTRQAVQTVKTADHKKNLLHYMKQSAIRSKQSVSQHKEDPQHNSDARASDVAIDDIQTTWKKSVYESKFRVQNQIREYRQNREYKSNPKAESKHNSRRNIIKDFTRNVTRKITAPIQNSYQVQMVKHAVYKYSQSIRFHNRITTTFSNIISFGGKAIGTGVKAVRSTVNGVSFVFSAGSGVLLIITMTLFFGMFSSFTNTSVLAQGIEIPEASVQPDFTNDEAWGENNPYTRLGFIGQCTWFAWGRFYEIYGYDPGFTGDGWSCASQLVAAHPDKFELSYAPAPGAVFSTIGHNHVGIVIAVEGDKITIQDGNLDGVSNTFLEAMTDWKEETMSISEFVAHHGGVIYAVPILIDNN